MQSDNKFFEQIKEYLISWKYGVQELNEVWGRLNLAQKNHLFKIIGEALEEAPNEAVQEWASAKQASTPAKLGDTGYYALVPPTRKIIENMVLGVAELRSNRGIESLDQLPQTLDKGTHKRLRQQLTDIQKRTVAPAPPAATDMDDEIAWFYEVTVGVEPITKEQAYTIYRQDIEQQNKGLQLEAYLAAVVDFAELYNEQGQKVDGNLFIKRRERGIFVYGFNSAIRHHVRKPTIDDFEVNEDTNAMRERIGLAPLHRRRATNETEQRLVWFQIAVEEWPEFYVHAIAMIGHYSENLLDGTEDTVEVTPEEVDPKQVVPLKD